MYKLTIQIPDGDLVVYELIGPSLTLGRHESNDIVIKHQSVSSRHASLTQIGGHYQLKDLGSTNKTWLNGVAIGEVLLNGNYALRFGMVEGTYEELESAENELPGDSPETLQALAQLTAERDAMQKEVSDLTAKLDEEQQKTLKALALTAEQNTKLESLAQALETKEQALTAALGRAEEADKLKSQLAAAEALKTQLQETERARDESTKALEQRQLRVEALEAEALKLEQAHVATGAERDQANEKARQLNATAEALQQSISALEKESVGLKAERDRWSAKSGQQHTEMEQLQQRFAAAQSQIESLKSLATATAQTEQERGSSAVPAIRDDQLFSAPESLSPGRTLDPQIIFSPDSQRLVPATNGTPAAATPLSPAPRNPPPPAGALRHAGPHTASISKMKGLLQRLIQHPSQSGPLQSLLVELQGISAWASGANSPAGMKSAEVLGGLLTSFSDAPERMTPSALRTVSQSLDTLAALLSAPQAKRTAALHEGLVIGVDPDESGRAEITEALSHIGLACACFATAADALKYCEKNGADLWIAEMNLPDTTVPDFCESLRAISNGGHAPLLLFTRSLSIENRTQFIAAGASDFLTKPLHAAELAARSLNWILRSRLA
jgi:pSer/pThr/pTyr-binding forkhead associated (FHA) protein/CheY-like chemotaxis protein